MIEFENSNFLLRIEEQVWDSSVLGYKCGFFSITEKKTEISQNAPLDSLIREAVVKSKFQDYRFITAKVI